MVEDFGWGILSLSRVWNEIRIKCKALAYKVAQQGMDRSEWI